MPRPSLVKVPLSQFKGSASFLNHTVRRDDFFDKLAFRYPIYTRLPECWRRQYETLPPEVNRIPMEGTKRPQHSGLWTKDDQGNPIPAKNYRLTVRYTKDVLNGLWGGEGIVEGLKHPGGRKWKEVHSRMWRPATHVKTFWSEVLEREITTTVSARTLRLIDEAFGFDNYILKTPEFELCSTFGATLKREMLLRLLNKDNKMYVSDPETREKVYERYKEFMMPKEEAEWIGLSLREAMKKQWELEKKQGVHDPVPLLQVYTEELKRSMEAEKSAKVSLPKTDMPSGTPDSPVFQAPK